MNDPSTSSPDTLSLSGFRHVIALCDRYEAAWRSGQGPRIEEYVGLSSGPERGVLLRKLLELDLDLRRGLGERPTPEEYVARFREYGDLIAAAFAEIVPPQDTPPWPTDREGSWRGPAPDARSSDGSDGPDILGDYRLLGRIGKGGMGVVYRAEQLGVGRIVALKLIKPELLDDLTDDQRAEIVGRFQAEARAAARLDHDHIVTVYEVGEVGGRHFYSMRYVEGQSLGDALAGGPLANHKAATYLEAVARAVGYAHARGILHRDLKPRNILVDSADRPFVADFGLAKSLEDKPGRTRTGDWVGSPPYMSPEQFRSPSLVGPASDVYALGATLYEMLTRRPPFQGPSPAETLRQVVDTEPVSPRMLNPAVHRDLETICLKCLEKDPSRRYGSAEDLAEDLARYRAGRPIRARPVGRLERAWRWSLRNPALAAAWGLGTTAAAVAVALSVAYGIQRSYAAERLREEQAATEHRRLEAVAARQVAADRYTLALKAFQSLIVEVGPRLRGSPELRTVQRKLLTTAASGLQELTRGDPDRSTFRAYLQWGDIERILGQTAAARARFEDARRIARALLDVDGRDPEAIRDLATACQKLGDVALLTGPTEAARDEFLECLRLCRQADEMAPGDAASRLALASALDRVGDAAFQLNKTEEAGVHYREALRIRKEVDEAGRGGPEVKAGLTASYTKIGDQALQRNALDEADAAYRAGADAAARLVEQEPDDPGYLRRLSVFHIKRGDIAVRADDLATAEGWYRKSLELDEARVELDPTSDEVRRDLAISYNRVGQVELDRKEYAAARESFLKGLAPTRRRVDADPSNRQAQRDLSVSHNKIGDACFELGALAEARDHYNAGLAILERLAGADRADADVRLGLAIAYERVGDVNLKLGHPAKASRAYRDSLALGEDIARADPANIDAQTGLIVAHSKVAEAAYRSADPVPAVEGLERALAILSGLRAKGLLKGQPMFDRWQKELEQAAVLARSMVAAIRGGPESLKPSDDPKARAEVLHARVVALANRRRLGEAAATVEALRAQADSTSDPEVLLYAARGFAALAGADRGPARGRHAEQAVALLGRLRAAGAFRDDPGRAAWLAEAEDLDPLRGRTDFQAFLAGLKAPPAKPP